MSIQNLSSTQLRKAADLTEQIEKLNNELSELLGSPAAKVPGKRGPKKGGMSAEGRARIATAQKARWAKANSQIAETVAEKMISAVAKVKPVKKRKMSAAGRAAIIAAQKARWAKKKG